MLELELVELAYLLSPVRAMVVRSTGYIPLIETSLQRGTEVTLPLWLAEVLEAHGYVQIQDKLLSPRNISELRFLQFQNRSHLIKLDSYFYSRARKTVIELEERAKKESDLVLLKTVEKAKQDIFEIFKTRLNTILRAIQLGGANTIEKQLTMEERVLLNRISRIVDEWIKRYAGFI